MSPKEKYLRKINITRGQRKKLKKFIENKKGNRPPKSNAETYFKITKFRN